MSTVHTKARCQKLSRLLNTLHVSKAYPPVLSLLIFLAGTNSCILRGQTILFGRNKFFYSAGTNSFIQQGQILLFSRDKFFFAGSADGAYPVIRKILKGCSRLNAVIRITYLRVVFITTGFAYIFFHSVSPFK